MVLEGRKEGGVAGTYAKGSYSRRTRNGPLKEICEGGFFFGRINGARNRVLFAISTKEKKLLAKPPQDFPIPTPLYTRLKANNSLTFTT